MPADTHDLLDRGDRHRRRLEVAEPVSARDRQRRPSELVLPVPDVDPRALGREELHRERQVLVGRAVHRRFVVFVDRVDIDAQIERHLHRLEHFLFRAGVLAGRARAEPGGRHQRIAAIDVGRQGIRAQLHIFLHQLRVRRDGRQQEGRRADFVPARVGEVVAPRDARIDLGALRDSFPGELEARHGAGALGTRVVIADAGLAHVDDHVQHGVPELIGIRVRARVQQL